MSQVGNNKSGSLTPQQRAAVVARQVSVVLSSGAGCGKTHVLTERYLSHLREDGAEVGQIVAITFTDRAARQMRGRIRQEVSRLLRLAADDDEAETWSRHLRGLETAPISTIHAFCGTLLRQYAVEAGLDARFDVLEEVLAFNLEAEAINIGLQTLLTIQGEAGDDMRRLVLLFGWRTVVEGVRHLLHSWDERRWLAWLDRPTERLSEECQQHCRTVLVPRYLDHVVNVRPAITACIALLRRYPPQPGPMVEQVELILRELPRLGEAADLGAAAEELAKAAQVGKIGKQAWPDDTIYEQIKETFTRFREDLRSHKLDHFRADSAGLTDGIEVGKRFVRVVREVVKSYTEKKRLTGVVDFQDLLTLARDLVRDNRDVRERLQERYRFLLLDEAQDTDPVQMELIGLLSGAALSTGKLFAVGDVNQSIYRFRGADVRQFQDLRLKMPHEGRLGLTVNFRSQPALLNFANALLGHRLADYEPLTAFHPQVNPEPCVEFLWSPRPGKGSDDGEDEDRATAPKGGVTEGRIVEADWIARRIAAMVGKEQLVVERPPGQPGSLRPVRAGDVVMLFRAMSNVHLYEAALRRYGLNYYLVGGRAFFAQQEIYDLLNLLRTLENPQDFVSLAGTLRSPFCCLSDEALFVLARAKEGLWAGLHDEALESNLPGDQREPVRRAQRHLDHWRGLKDRLPIARLLGVVFADSGFDAATQFEFLGDRKLANLWKLMDLARTFDRSGLFGLAEFIGRLGDLVKSESREEQAATQPENADVVRLMTIHQAKGLEFPVVIVPDLMAAVGGPSFPTAQWDTELGCVVRPPLDEDEPPFSDFGWHLWQTRTTLEEWQEDLRTFYVACTRARDYLILSSSLPDPFKPANAWMLTLNERFAISSGQCLAADIPPERRPRVTVFNHLHPPPTPPEAVPLSAPDELALELPPAPAPFSARRSPGEGIVALDDLQEWSRRQGTLLETLPETELQGSTNDGWDRNDCAGPHRLQDRRTNLERVVRGALSVWDFANPEGWQSALQTWQQESIPGDVSWAVEILQRFAASTFRATLAAAGSCQHDADYLLRLPDGNDLPTLRGSIDCLWQDAKGGRHLLFYTFGAAPGDAGWNERLPELVLAATAVYQQTGAWPSDVTLFNLRDGSSIRRSASRLPHRRVLAQVAADLTALVRQPGRRP
jgi:ATP-dependent helicase/nuclease subunit A